MHQTIQQSLVGKGVGVEGKRRFAKALYEAVISSKLVASNGEIKDLIILGEQILEDQMVTAILDSIEVSTPQQVEMKVEFEVPGVPIPVVGYIDIIDDFGHPYDIKTSKWDWTDERAVEEDQPDFYLTALSILGDTRHQDKFSHVIITKNGAAPAAYIITTERKDYQEKVFKMVQTMWRGVQNELWNERVVIEACATCRIRSECYRKNNTGV